MYNLTLHVQLISILQLELHVGIKSALFLCFFTVFQFPFILCRFYKTMTGILPGQVTQGDSFNLPTLLGIFILNVFSHKHFICQNRSLGSNNSEKLMFDFQPNPFLSTCFSQMPSLELRIHKFIVKLQFIIQNGKWEYTS